ncbi:MAG: hypothetical protein N2378_15665 [Chloroflexaceae bacterium]|nr:hypothetical protein [Chloroflexaceae bacterium]
MTADALPTGPMLLEQLIYQVRGVQAARLITDPQGQIDEIHVVGTPQRNPKQIVRDIESILYVRGGVRLDHRKISLVQVAERETTTGRRLQLLEVTTAAGEAGTQVEVRLALQERRFEGSACDSGEVASRSMLAAAATIEALNRAIGARGSFRLERLQRQPLGELDTFLTHLSFVLEGSFEALLGVSVVREDEATAAARAVLDAANRRVERLLSDPNSQG